MSEKILLEKIAELEKKVQDDPTNPEIEALRAEISREINRLENIPGKRQVPEDLLEIALTENYVRIASMEESLRKARLQRTQLIDRLREYPLGGLVWQNPSDERLEYDPGLDSIEEAGFERYPSLAEFVHFLRATEDPAFNSAYNRLWNNLHNIHHSSGVHIQQFWLNSGGYLCNGVVRIRLGIQGITVRGNDENQAELLSIHGKYFRERTHSKPRIYEASMHDLPPEAQTKLCGRVLTETDKRISLELTRFYQPLSMSIPGGITVSNAYDKAVPLGVKKI